MRGGQVGARVRLGGRGVGLYAPEEPADGRHAAREWPWRPDACHEPLPPVARWEKLRLAWAKCTVHLDPVSGSSLGLFLFYLCFISRDSFAII